MQHSMLMQCYYIKLLNQKNNFVSRRLKVALVVILKKDWGY